MNNDRWAILIISLPGQTGTARMRIWRALKSCGAGILRDGVYVLPYIEESRAELDAQANSVEEAGGSAYRLDYATEDPDLRDRFIGLFDRATDYEEWLADAAELLDNLAVLDESEARRKEAYLRRRIEALAQIDYFPGEAKSGAVEAMKEVATAVNLNFSPDEPSAQFGNIELCAADDFAGRQWATRSNLWVDRVASAWLVRRFIDPDASFLWLQRPGDCPAEAVGFDFDGATFSHVGDLVTFEVLLHSFDMDKDSALSKLGSLVHYLDVGGLPVADAAGFLTMLTGVRQQHPDDDAFLDSAGSLLDHLYAAYTRSERT